MFLMDREWVFRVPRPGARNSFLWTGTPPTLSGGLFGQVKPGLTISSHLPFFSGRAIFFVNHFLRRIWGLKSFPPRSSNGQKCLETRPMPRQERGRFGRFLGKSQVVTDPPGGGGQCLSRPSFWGCSNPACQHAHNAGGAPSPSGVTKVIPYPSLPAGCGQDLRVPLPRQGTRTL